MAFLFCNKDVHFCGEALEWQSSHTQGRWGDFRLAAWSLNLPGTLGTLAPVREPPEAQVLCKLGQ